MGGQQQQQVGGALAAAGAERDGGEPMVHAVACNRVSAERAHRLDIQRGALLTGLAASSSSSEQAAAAGGASGAARPLPPPRPPLQAWGRRRFLRVASSAENLWPRRQGERRPLGAATLRLHAHSAPGTLLLTQTPPCDSVMRAHLRHERSHGKITCMRRPPRGRAQTPTERRTMWQCHHTRHVAGMKTHDQL